MNEDAFNMSIRKFLKKVGVTSQREIETAVRAALESQDVAVADSLPASITLAIPAIGLSVEIEGQIELE